MTEPIIVLGLSISVLTNLYSLWRLLGALKKNDNLEARLSNLENELNDNNMRDI